MEKQMLSELDVLCPPQEAAQRIHDVFYHGKNAGSFELEVPFERLGFPAIGKFSRHVTLTLGTPERRSDDATLIPLVWRDARSANFPQFEGYFEIMPLDQRSVQVAVIGDYVPPMGPVGAAFDAAVGRHIAEVTVEELLHHLRVELEKS